MEGREVYSGICQQDSTVVCGVTVPQDFCDAGTWVPPFLVAASDHPSRICSGHPYRTAIGRCGTTDGAPGPCSNLASRCDNPASFVARDDTCTITHDRLATTADGAAQERQVEYTGGGGGSKEGRITPFRQWTIYGSCDGRCVWSPEDCAAGEVYLKNDAACTADKVSLGACLDGFAYCVATKENCKAENAEEEPYLSHQELLDQYKVDCYLADLGKILLPPSPSPPPTPILPTTPNPTTTTSAPDPVVGEATESKSSGFNRKPLLVFVLTVLLLRC